VTRADRRPPAGWRPRAAATLLTVLAILALAADRSAATVVVAKDFAALCREADLIFVGTVVSVESQWSDADKQSIETLVTFDDLTWLRGTPQPSVTLRFGGGEVDGLHEEIAGAPHFTEGERRVIFAHDGRYVSPIVGFDQGALRVVDGSSGPTVMGAPAPTTVNGALHLGTPPADGGSAVPLDEFLDRVQRQLALPAGGGQ
jgi:hypothetical protein